MLSLRYGGMFKENTTYRVWAKGARYDENVFESGEDAADDWDSMHMGFRVDSTLSPEDEFTLSGAFFDADQGETLKIAQRHFPYSINVDDTYNEHGGHLFMRWDHEFDNDDSLEVRAFIDEIRSHDLVLHNHERIMDLDVQYNFADKGRHKLSLGAGYRNTNHKSDPSFHVSYDPQDRTDQHFSIFAYDEISFFNERLRLMLGSKFEHNDYTGFEMQPSVRLAWSPNDTSLLWGSISRVTRTPSRSESDIRLNPITAPLTIVSVFGNDEAESEVLITYELGYRSTPIKTLSIDLTLFYNDYEKFRSINLNGAFVEWDPFPPHLVVSLSGDNSASLNTYGVEFSSEWRPDPRYRFMFGYSYLHLDKPPPKVFTLLNGYTNKLLDSAPEHTVQIGLSATPVENFECDVMFRWVDKIAGLEIDDYLAADLRLGWHAREDLLFEIIGRNLLNDHHQEFDSMFVPTIATEIERSVLARITWEF